MPLTTWDDGPSTLRMNPYIEIVYAVPSPNQGEAPAMQKRMTAVAAGLEIGQDANGRAVVFRPLGVGNASQQLPTYETYDAVAARLATITPANPTARVSSQDQQSATSARQTDASKLSQNQSQA